MLSHGSLENAIRVKLHSHGIDESCFGPVRYEIIFRVDMNITTFDSEISTVGERSLEKFEIKIFRLYIPHDSYANELRV